MQTTVLAVYISGVAASLAAYTAWLLEQGQAVDDPARLYAAYLKAQTSLQDLYQSLPSADKTTARAISYRLVRAHAYSLGLYLKGAA